MGEKQVAENTLSEALAHLVRQGDTGEIRRFLYEVRLLDYTMKHEVRMSGAHMAKDCLGKVCEPFPTFEVWDAS
jgi:hypothetical protein